MSFKFALVCATLAVVSCGRMDQQELSRQMQQQQQEMIQQQNEHIREQHRVENNQRQAQMRELEDQVRQQEQLARDQQQVQRDQEQQNRENNRVNGNVFIAPRPHFVNAPIQFVQVPSSFNNFERRNDDSNYNFAYAISDLTTGDVKSQNEIRRGDQVQGSYRMMDADGYQRTVEYRADDRNGFDAEVRREPAQGLRASQFIRIDDSNNFATHFFHPANQFFALRPTIFATTSVSRRDDGQRNEYSTATASNF